MLENKLKYIAEQTYMSLKRYNSRSRFLFQDIPLEDARVLDIGCGIGELSLWAALNGASYVVGIEPESEGSKEGTLLKFQSMIQNLGLQNVIARADYLETLPLALGPFSIAVMYNVINHLDETSVVELHKNVNAVNKYKRILTTLFTLMEDNGIVIMADCSSHNFWNSFWGKNPFAPTREWHKHQPPSVWIPLFEEVGFKVKDLRWSPIYRLSSQPTNYFLQYITLSHFVLRFTKF